jgi:integrase
VQVSPQPSRRGRRADHEGTVYQIKRGPRSGEWRAQLSLPGGRRKNFSGRSRAEVEQKLLDARHAVSHGRLLPPRADTLAEYARGWLRARQYELSPRSQVVYRQVLDDHILPEIGHLPLLDIQPQHVRQMHVAVFDKGLKPRTVRLAHAVLSAVLDQAEKDQLVPLNVAGRVRLPRALPTDFTPLDPAEIQTLIAAMRGDPLEALFLLTLTTGLRRGEVCGVRWRDLDLERGSLRLVGQIQRQPGKGLAFVPLKSTTGHGHLIALAAPVVEAVEAHRDRQAFARAQARELWTEQGYVFTNAIGGPLDPMQAYRCFKALLQRAGLRDQRFHDLRHAAASLLLGWGMDLWQVSKLLRHSGIAITSDVYGHLYQQTGRELAERMGAFVEQAR